MNRDLDPVQLGFEPRSFDDWASGYLALLPTRSHASSV